MSGVFFVFFFWSPYGIIYFSVHCVPCELEIRDEGLIIFRYDIHGKCTLELVLCNSNCITSGEAKWLVVSRSEMISFKIDCFLMVVYFLFQRMKLSLKNFRIFQKHVIVHLFLHFSPSLSHYLFFISHVIHPHIL